MKNSKILGGIFILASVIFAVILGLIIYACTVIVLYSGFSHLIEQLYEIETMYMVIIVLFIIFCIFLAVLSYVFLRYGIKIIRNPKYKFNLTDFINFQ